MFKISVIVLLIAIIGLQIASLVNHVSLANLIDEVDTRVYNHDKSEKFDIGIYPRR